MKLTVSEYASKYNVSPQSVYKRIQRGTMPTSKENGTVYVIVDDIEVEERTQPVQSSPCTELLSIIENLQEENKHLAEMLDKANDNKDALFHKFMNVLAIQEKPAPVPDKEEEEVTDAEEAEIEEEVVFTKEEEQELKRLKKKRKKKKLSKEEKVTYKILKAKQNERDHGV